MNNARLKKQILKFNGCCSNIVKFKISIATNLILNLIMQVVKYKWNAMLINVRTIMFIVWFFFIISLCFLTFSTL